MLYSICQQIWKTQQWSQDRKVSFHFNPKEGNFFQTTRQLHSFSMLLRLCSKSFKLGFSSMWTEIFQMYKLGLEKAEDQRSDCQHLLDHQKSKKVPEKHLLLLYWLRQSLWPCRSQQMDSSVFLKSNLYIWKFTVHILLKPSLKNFERYFASMWNKCNCAVAWIFVGIVLLWD